MRARETTCVAEIRSGLLPGYQRFAVPFGKYEDVPEVNRIDVENCHRVRISEEDFCRRLTADYGTESAILVCHIVLFEIICKYIENSPRSQSAPREASCVFPPHSVYCQRNFTRTSTTYHQEQE
jgi:hypothetical protein